MNEPRISFVSAAGGYDVYACFGKSTKNRIKIGHVWQAGKGRVWNVQNASGKHVSFALTRAGGGDYLRHLTAREDITEDLR